MSAPTDVPKTVAEMNAGQRLHCAKCGSEVEIIQPCPCRPSDLSLRCCGQDMVATVGEDVHLGVE